MSARPRHRQHGVGIGCAARARAVFGAQLLLLRAALRDAPVQFLLTAIVVASAAAVLTMAIALFDVGRDPLRRARAAAGDPTLVVTGTARDVRAAARLPGIAAAGRGLRQRHVLLRGSGLRIAVALREWDDAATVDRPLVERGRPPRLWSRSEVVAERTFARAFGLAVGDRLTVGGRGVRVVGIAGTVSLPPFDRARETLMWAPTQLVATVSGRSELVRAIRLADRSSSALARFRARLRALAPRARIATTKAVAADYAQLTRLETVVLQTFALLGLAASCFVFATATSSRVLSRTYEVGLLKALGLGPIQVGSRYLLENLALAVPAVAIGTIVGLAASRPLLAPLVDLVGAPFVPWPGGGTAAIAAAIALAAVALATLPAIGRAVAARVGSALALGRPQMVAAHRARLAGLALRLQVPAPIALGVAETFARRPRAWLCAATLAFAAAMLVALASMEHTYARLLADPARDGRPWDVQVEPAAIQPNLLASAERDSGAHVRSRAVIARVGARVAGRRVVVRVARGAWRSMQPTVTLGRPLRRSGEALIGRRLLGELGVATGDRVRVEVGGRQFVVRVVGRYVEPFDRALTLWVSAATLRRAGLAPPPARQLLLRLDDPGRDRAFARALRERVRGAFAVAVSRDIWRSERAQARRVVYALEAVLLGIAVINVLCAFLLAVKERARNLALYKALGLTPRELAGVVTAGAALLAVLATAAGVPLGMWVFRTLVIVLNPHDGPDVVAWAPPWALATLLPVALLLATAAALPPARRAARLAPAATLRSE